MGSGITVVIPHLPTRAAMLQRALASIATQTLAPDQVIVETDDERSGIASVADTRNRALAKVTTPLVAFLDDDDELYPTHLDLLAKGLDASGAHLAHAGFDVVGAPDHRPSFIEVTHLSKVAAIRDVGGFPQPFSGTWPYRYEDWGMLAKMLLAGYVFHRVNAITWRKHIHSSNMVGAGF